jgi:GAF domain-containing protein
MLGDAQQQLRVVARPTSSPTRWNCCNRSADQRPCLDFYRSGAPVSVADLTDAEARWPRFVAALAQRGTYGSVHALPLRLRGEPLGTLNLFHRPNKTLHPGQAPTAHNGPS